MNNSSIKSSSGYGVRKNSHSNNMSHLYVMSNIQENPNYNNIFQISDMNSQLKYSNMGNNNTNSINQSNIPTKNLNANNKQNDGKLLSTNVFINNLNIQIRPSSQVIDSAKKKIAMPQPQPPPNNDHRIKRPVRKSPQKIIEDDREDSKNILNLNIDDIKEVSNIYSSNYIEKLINNPNKQNYSQSSINKNDDEISNSRITKIPTPNLNFSYKRIFNFKVYK